MFFTAHATKWADKNKLFYFCPVFLNAHTYYSLRYGVLAPAQLVACAKRHGVRALALTDINTTAAAFDFVQACRKAGIHPVTGIEFRRDGRLLYIGLARNREGFAELASFLTEHSLQDEPLPDVAPAFRQAYVIYDQPVKPLRMFGEHEYLGIRPADANTLFRRDWLRYRDRLVVLQPVTFCSDQPLQNTDDAYRVHKLLRAIDTNQLVTRLRPADLCRPDEVFLPADAIARAFRAYPFVLDNTERLLASCEISFDSGLHINRRHFTTSKADDRRLLRKLAEEGARHRYGIGREEAVPAAIAGRIEKELRTIARLDFEAYFLITWDIVRYARSAGFYHVGRGSGANSIVAFCLGITDVDPVELDLYFERFINPYRVTPPDFDLDFSWQERDEVLDYIFKRYGRAHTALLATYATFRRRAAVRELGKAFGLPGEEIEVLLDYPDRPDLHHAFGRHIYRFAGLIESMPSHLSIHAGGVVITERPIAEWTALRMMPKGFPVAHLDMYAAERIGLHKFDILSQRGLGHIRNAIEYIRINAGKVVDIHDVKTIKRDKKVAELMRRGDALGCFYIESPAMRGLLRKLRCDTYRQLVAASSIIRPGVARSGMMKAYIERHHHPHGFRYLHPLFEKHLKETYGIMVYQEDVIKIVHHFAGLDLNESDVLRRIMSGKKHKRETLDRLRTKFFANCRARGYPKALAEEVWRQIESFSGYSFSKAHSASFAVESMQSLYLKAHWPLEFIVAVINNFGGFYETEYYFHEARRAGATVHPPCVNHSLYLTTLYGKDIYTGFVHIRGLERQVGRYIVRERLRHGAYQSLADFVNRVPVSRTQLELLIRIGAFRFTGISKHELLWHKNALWAPRQSVGTATLFETNDREWALPPLDIPAHEQALAELELLGFTLESPFRLLAHRLASHPVDFQEKVKFARRRRASDFDRYTGRRIMLVGYFVTEKRLRTATGKRMSFGTWYDEDGVFFDTVHFPPSLRQYPFRGKGLYLLAGRVADDFGVKSLEVSAMWRI